MRAANKRTTTTVVKSKTTNARLWSEEEHDKFLVGLKVFPRGPWRMIAAQVGTRTPRQVQTHAQKYYEKVERRLRGLRKDRKKVARPEHRLDEDMMQLCKVAECDVEGARIGPYIGRGLSALVAASTMSVNAATDEAAENGDCCTHTDAFGSPSTESTLSKVADSDDADSLADFDDHCLNYLMEVLECASECGSDDSCPEIE